MKKIIAIILAIAIIAGAAIAFFIFNPNDKGPEVPPENDPPVQTQPTDPEPTEPEPTKPIPGTWYLSALKDPEIYETRADEIGKEGVEFVTFHIITPHLTIDEIDGIFDTNEFLKKDMKKNPLRGITERWNNDKYAIYDDNGMRIYDAPFTVAYDEKIVGTSQDGEEITVTCRTEHPAFNNSNIVIVECKNMPLDKYHKVLDSVLSDIYGKDIANYLIYASDKDKEIDEEASANGEYMHDQCLKESFDGVETRLILTRNITTTGDLKFVVEYAPIIFQNRAQFVSDINYQSWYNAEADNAFNTFFPNLQISGNTNVPKDTLLNYFALNNSKSIDKTTMDFWTAAHEPVARNNERVVYCTTVEEDNKQTTNVDWLNVLSDATYDKDGKMIDLLLYARGLTHFIKEDEMSADDAVKQAAKMIEQQIEYVYDIDVTVDINTSLSNVESPLIITHTHPLTNKTMEITLKWTIEQPTSTQKTIVAFWSVDAITVK